MITRFVEVTNGLYRGSGPSTKDVIALYKEYGIRKIISLDEEYGKKINKVCKLLNIKHIIIPIDGKKPKPLAKLFSYDLYDLLMKDGPTYVHCIHGKDRTGLVIALFQCKYLGMSCEDAIHQAISLGFGVGLDKSLIKFYEKLICQACRVKHTHTCQHHKDVNDADIVENTHVHDDFAGSVIDNATMQSFAPYMDGSKQYPYSPQYGYQYEQWPTRENRNTTVQDQIEGLEDAIPQVGLFDYNEGIRGAGPIDNGGGFTAT